MKSVNKIWIAVALMVVVALATFSCSNEFNRSTSPVELIVTNTQVIQRFDIDPAALNCDKDITAFIIASRLKAADTNVDQRFNDVRITSYRVSYRRIDGGTAVPAPIVRPIDVLVPAGGTAPTGKIVLVTGDALNQAPFASLRATNGGRDPETGRMVVTLEITVEFFGETLAGTNVSGSSHLPLDFCFQCQGCK